MRWINSIFKNLLRCNSKGFKKLDEYYYPKRIETTDTARIFSRLFRSDDGRVVLAHLQAMTMARACDAKASDAQLRFNEGQRALVFYLMSMVEKGRN